VGYGRGFLQSGCIADQNPPPCYKSKLGPLQTNLSKQNSTEQAVKLNKPPKGDSKLAARVDRPINTPLTRKTKIYEGATVGTSTIIQVTRDSEKKGNRKKTE